MSLDVLLEPIPAKSKTPCKVGKVLASLDDPYKTALLNLLNTKFSDGGLADEHVAERLERAGFDIGATTVRTHRKGMCSCE